MSIDPVVTDVKTGSSFNRYAYVNNNPYKFIDPDGRDPFPWNSQPYQEPHAEVRQMLTSLFGSGMERAPVSAATGAVTKSTLTISYFEVSRTTKVGGDGSTYVGMRLTPGYAYQTSVEEQAKLGDGGGVTVKTSASAGIGLIGVTGSLSATAGADGLNVQASGGVVGAASNKGGIWGIKPPTVGVGITIKDKKEEITKN